MFKDKYTVSKTVRDALDTLDTAMADMRHDDLQAIWDVLTALRGPDNSDPDAKGISTEYVRRDAFPKAAEAITFMGAFVAAEGRTPSNFSFTTLRRMAGSAHFAQHVISAMLRLGIIEGDPTNITQN